MNLVAKVGHCRAVHGVQPFGLHVSLCIQCSNLPSSSPAFGILRANAHVFENTHLGICHERRVPGGISLLNHMLKDVLIVLRL